MLLSAPQSREASFSGGAEDPFRMPEMVPRRSWPPRRRTGWWGDEAMRRRRRTQWSS